MVALRGYLSQHRAYTPPLMRLGLNQSTRLDQRLLQSPQMIQAMQILQLPALELEARIQQELEENPFLELVDGAPVEDGDERPIDGETALEALERVERDALGPEGAGLESRSRRDDEADKKFEAMANTPDLEKSLPEALLEELAMLEWSARERDIAEYLVWSLDGHGWLPVDREALLRELVQPEDPQETPMLGPDAAAPTLEEVETILYKIRSVTHPAIGARDLRDCLQLQLLAHGWSDASLPWAIVQQHLEDVEHNRLPRIAKERNASLEQIKDAIEVVKSLDPNPGAGFGYVRADAILPEILVEEVDGEWIVRLDRARTTRVQLSPAHKELLREAKKGAEAREWVKKRLENARWFLDALQQRESTLERIARSIFARQRPFLEKGVSGLRPLRMQEVADEVSVHISTVSRAVAGKYAQTPRGILPLKYFFTGGTVTEDGEMQSQASIKQRIADLIKAEDRSKPLSDEDLAEALEKQDGVKIARRTVTKYRKALNIPSSTERRAF